MFMEKTRIVESFGVPKLVVGPDLNSYGICYGAKVFENGMVAILDSGNSVSVYRNAEDHPIISGYEDVYMYKELNVCLKLRDGTWFLVSRDAFFVNDSSYPYMSDDISRYIVAQGSDIKVKNGIIALKSLDENVGWEFYSLHYAIKKLPIVCDTSLGSIDEYMEQTCSSYVLSVMDEDVEKPSLLYAMNDFCREIINSVEACDYKFVKFKSKGNFVISDDAVQFDEDASIYHFYSYDTQSSLQLYDCRLNLRHKDCDEIYMMSHDVYFIRKGKEWTLYGAENEVIKSGLVNLKFYGTSFVARLKNDDSQMFTGHKVKDVIMCEINDKKTMVINLLGRVVEFDGAMTRIEML